MFSCPQQRRKFAVPGLKRKAPEPGEQSAALGRAGPATTAKQAKGPEDALSLKSCVEAKRPLSRSDKPSEKENKDPSASLPTPKKVLPLPKPSLNNIKQNQIRLNINPVPRFSSTQPATPLGPSQGTAAAPVAADIFSVLYTKRDKFKKKSAKNYQDGVVELNQDGHATLYDSEGKVVTKCKIKKPPALEDGAILELNSLIAEYDREIPVEEFQSGACFIDSSALGAGPSSNSLLALLPSSKGSKPPKARTTGLAGGSATSSAVLMDPLHPDAIILNQEQWQNGAGKQKNGQAVMPVVIDPYISRQMRPHQKAGIKFMYDCTTGQQTEGHYGCILADEMGLGKTLQVIGLIWTLLRQGPLNTPLVRKAVVVTPASLCKNWAKEVNKWLGTERLKVMVFSQGAAAAEQVKDFKQGSVWKLLLGSYETLRKYAHELEGCCDLLVCDEGHRLKASGGNKTITALLQLGCQRRIILTGTPVQNNMEELYALLSFVAPGILGTMATFKRVYGDPITASRDTDASEEQRELGAARAQELQRKVGVFVLRRTQEILAKHLPPLARFTLFCTPTAVQVAVYEKILRSPNLASLLHSTGGGSDEGVLPAITVLRKLCNHPQLLQPGDKKGGTEATHGVAAVAVAALRAELDSFDGDAVALSGKLASLRTMLDAIHTEGGRTVVVSTSTSALDLIEQLVCSPRAYRTARIDGGTSVDDRQVVVDNFNNLGMGEVFLLSTRAGGAGLNLVGANHLVLFDSDWNPAMDKQAMARIWRDGQKKSCFIYRMLTTGTIEEKVYQRQLMKSDLAAATIEVGSGCNQLSHNELKQLFQLDKGAVTSTQRLVPGRDTAGGGGGSGASSQIVWLDLAEPRGLPRALAASVAGGGITAVNQECHAGQEPAAAGGADSATTAPTAAADLGSGEKPAGGQIDQSYEMEGEDGQRAGWEVGASSGALDLGGEPADWDCAGPHEDDVMCLDVDF